MRSLCGAKEHAETGSETKNKSDWRKQSRASHAPPWTGRCTCPAPSSCRPPPRPPSWRKQGTRQQWRERERETRSRGVDAPVGRLERLVAQNGDRAPPPGQGGGVREPRVAAERVELRRGRRFAGRHDLAGVGVQVLRGQRRDAGGAVPVLLLHRLVPPAASNPHASVASVRRGLAIRSTQSAPAATVLCVSVRSSSCAGMSNVPGPPARSRVSDDHAHPCVNLPSDSDAGCTVTPPFSYGAALGVSARVGRSASGASHG